MTLYDGTVEYYAKYRPGYAPEFYQKVFAECAIDKKSVVMDLACGPGIVALDIAPQVRKVIAVDIEQEFIAKGKELAAERGLSNIEWHLLAAEEITTLGQMVDMIICSHAFHWLNREKVAELAFRMLRPNGALVITSDMTAAHWTTDKLKKLVNKLTGNHLDKINKTRRCDCSKTHEQVLAEAGFIVNKIIVDCGIRLTNPEKVLGWYLSTSFANPKVLGGNLQEFKTKVLKLLNSMPAEAFQEDNKAQAIIAFKK